MYCDDMASRVNRVLVNEKEERLAEERRVKKEKEKQLEEEKRIEDARQHEEREKRRRDYVNNVLKKNRYSNLT